MGRKMERMTMRLEDFFPLLYSSSKVAWVSGGSLASPCFTLEGRESANDGVTCRLMFGLLMWSQGKDMGRTKRVLCYENFLGGTYSSR